MKYWLMMFLSFVKYLLLFLALLFNHAVPLHFCQYGQSSFEFISMEQISQSCPSFIDFIIDQDSKIIISNYNYYI